MTCLAVGLMACRGGAAPEARAPEPKAEAHEDAGHGPEEAPRSRKDRPAK